MNKEGSESDAEQVQREEQLHKQQEQVASINTNIKLLTKSCDIKGESNFTKGCKFSPDGLCILTATDEDNTFRLYNNPMETYQHWSKVLSTKAGDSIRSYDWYPYMNSSQPESCAFVAASRDQPIHLYDAYNGSIRASYCPYNALDEMESPNVVQFTPDGSRIFAGGFRTDRTIHTFDVSRPGRDSDILRLGKTRRSKDGQKGILSALAFPSTTSVFSKVFAVATYSPGSIFIYDDRLPNDNPGGTILHGICVMGYGKSFTKKRRFVDISMESNDTMTAPDNFDDMVAVAKTKYYQARVRTGVTQLAWANRNGGHLNDYLLYSASRNSDAIIAFDLRMLTGMEHPIRGVGSFPRNGQSNQRLEFDFNSEGTRIYIAENENTIKIYDTTSYSLVDTISGFDTITNGVSFGRYCDKSFLAVSTGCRQFNFPKDEDNLELSETCASFGGLYLYDLKKDL